MTTFSAPSASAAAVRKPRHSPLRSVLRRRRDSFEFPLAKFVTQQTQAQ